MSDPRASVTDASCPAEITVRNLMRPRRPVETVRCELPATHDEGRFPEPHAGTATTLKRDPVWVTWLVNRIGKPTVLTPDHVSED